MYRRSQVAGGPRLADAEQAGEEPLGLLLATQAGPDHGGGEAMHPLAYLLARPVNIVGQRQERRLATTAATVPAIARGTAIVASPAPARIAASATKPGAPT